LGALRRRSVLRLRESSPATAAAARTPATTPVASIPVLLGPVLLGPILRGPVLLAPVLMRHHTRRALDRSGICRRRQLERRPDRIDLGRCLEVDRRAGGGRSEERRVGKE